MNSDRLLVKRLQKCDESAFDEIYHKYAQLLFHIIFSISENKDDANDILQDTFMVVLEKINTFNPTNNFKSWIITIAKNKAYDFIRKEKRLDRNTCLDSFASKRDFLREKTDFDLLMSQYEEIINRDEFNIITLHIFYQLKFSEIAKIYDRSISAVNNIYYRGINKIKAKYKRTEKHEKINPRIIY